jgi:predicted helicase
VQDVVFQTFSLGVSTNRDVWAVDRDIKNLQAKIKYFIKKYNEQLASGRVGSKDLDYSIKWSRDLNNKLQSGRKTSFAKKKIQMFCYRPFVKRLFYMDKVLIDRPPLFSDEKNTFIHFSRGRRAAFQVFATVQFASLDMFLPDAALSIPFYCKDNAHNITPWALKQFRKRYGNAKITRKQIFYYVYAVLYNPAYRKKYETNLKYDYPRIPFYDDFAQWTNWGKHLLDLHIGYEKVKPYPLQVVNKERRHIEPKAILDVNKTAGEIILDENTKLTGVPKEAWEYTIGKRSALEWILDQYKEKKPRSKTVAEQFNPYRFADYKERVIDLLQRVCTVSVETVKITEAMQIIKSN